jgi:hypothetical protein
MRWTALMIGAIFVVGCVVEQGDSGPTTEQGSEEQAEEVSEAVLTNRVFCKEGEQGAACSDKCVAQKIYCHAAYAAHPYKPSVGNGKLYACNRFVPIGWMCSYTYPNGDNCHFPFGRGPASLCI